MYVCVSGWVDKVGERRRDETYDVCVYVWWVWGEKKGGGVRCVCVYVWWVWGEKKGGGV